MPTVAPEFAHFVGPTTWDFYDTFDGALGSSATSALDKWTLLETDGSATQLRDLTSPGGVLKLTQAANDSDVISLIANSGIQGDALKPGEPIDFGCRFKLTDVSETNLYIGLGIHDTSYVASIPADFCAFRILEASADSGLQIVASKNSVLSSATNILTLADDTWVRAFFRYVPGSDTATGTLSYEAHSNGSTIAAQINTNACFPDDVMIFPLIQFQNGAAAADVCSIDYVMGRATYDWTPGQG